MAKSIESMAWYAPVFPTAMDPDKPASQVLEDAAELLDNEGWIQGDFQRVDGYCALGAINAVSMGQAYLNYQMGSNREAKLKLNEVMDCEISIFNDEPGRTKTEVQDKMIEAAKVLRNEGK